MDKIKIDFKKTENVSIKYNGKKIEIKPIIDVVSQVEIIESCTKQEIDLPLVKAVFNIAVLGLQTNIEIKEFSATGQGENHEINIKTKQEDINNYSQYDILDILYKNIVNYKETWDMVVKTIEIKNIKNAFSETVKNLPNEKEMNNSIEMISKFVQENPEFAKGFVKEQMIDRINETSKNELREKITEEKAKKLAEQEFEKLVEKKKAEIKSKNKRK